MCSTFSSTSYRFVLNRIVTFRKWICTIATASSQNNITYDMITANEFLLLQKFRNRMLTMHIAQILVRFGGFFPQAAGALRYFPENALHEYHKEVSNNTAMYTSTSCSRSPAPCSQYHICTSTDQAPCAAAALLFSWPGCLLLFGRLKNAKKRQVWPTASNVRKFKIAKFWDPAVCANILPNCEDVWVFSLNTAFSLALLVLTTD